MKQTVMTLLLFSTFVFQSLNSYASTEVALSEIEFDRSIENIKSGAQITMNICRLCHDLKYIQYQHLLEIGFTENEVDKLRVNKTKDSSIKSSTSEEIAKKLFGMVPPDLSLMAKARRGGDQYIYTLLTSYALNAEKRVENHLFPGIKMPDPFAYAIRTDEARHNELKKKIEQVAVFLKWTADPRAKERRRTGYFVIAYLFVLTFLLYLVKRKIWRRLE